METYLMLSQIGYFDVVPKELIEIILFNIESIPDYTNVYNSGLFNEILLDKKYWFSKIKLYCVIVNTECIPQDLLNFSSKSFEILLMNYFTIINAYNYTLSVTNCSGAEVRLRKDFIKSGYITEEDPAEDITWAYDLCLTNFELLKLNLIKHHEDMLVLSDFITNKSYRLYGRSGQRPTINITFSNKDEYEFKISSDSSDRKYIIYSVFRQDAINMIMHLRCNCAPEIEPF